MRSQYYKGYRIDYSRQGFEIYTGHNPAFFDTKLLHLGRGSFADACKVIDSGSFRFDGAAA